MLSFLNISAESISLLLPLTERTVEPEETGRKTMLPWQPGVHILSGAGHLNCSNVKSSCCSCTRPLSLSIRLTSGSAFQRNSLWTSYEGDPSSQCVCVCFHHKHLTHSAGCSWTCNSFLSPSIYTERQRTHVWRWICASRNAGDFLLGTESPQARFKASGNEFNQCVCFLSL